MDFSTSIVADFAILMTIAAVVYFIFYKFRQPTILGYLIAGVLIGPFTPPFSLVTRLDVIGAAADLGVILLLFGIGLRFPIPRLRKVGGVSIGVAAIEIAVMLALSFGVARLFDWPLMDALFLGTALASSSTTIIAKVLGDMGKLRETSSLIMLGVLIVEDLIVVGLLAVITSVLSVNSIDLDTVLWVVGKTAAFVLGTLIIGVLIVPRVIDRSVKLGNNELLLLIVLGLCFGASILAHFLGLSMAIGAFLMGVVVASSRSADYITKLISSVRDMFAAIFFVSMGALIDITQFRIVLVPALIVTGLMILGKMVGCGFGTRIFGYDRSTSLKVGFGMSQIGEFAFIVMKAGQDLAVISPFLFPVVGLAAGITTFLTPYLVRLSYKIRWNSIGGRARDPGKEKPPRSEIPEKD